MLTFYWDITRDSVFFDSVIGFGRQVFGRSHSRRQSTVDVWVVLQKDGTNDSRIDIIWAIVLDRKETPDEKHNLNQPIEGKPTEDNVWEELKDTEEGEDNPICKPFSVVLFVNAFQSFNWGIGRVYKANDITDQFCKVSEYHINGDQTNQSLSDINAFNSRRSLDFVCDVRNTTRTVQRFV